VDEPIAGLDTEERINFRNFLRDLLFDDDERIVILSPHIVSDISALCTDLLPLDRGKIRYKGNVNDMISIVKGEVWELTTDSTRIDLIEDKSLVVDSKVVDIDNVKIRHFI
jgi:ABC-2 type transport system ATP-binding protein